MTDTESTPDIAEDHARIAEVLWNDPRPIALTVGTNCLIIGNGHGLSVASLLDHWAARGHINRHQNDEVSAHLIALERALNGLRNA
jgi:hypothetical protein